MANEPAVAAFNPITDLYIYYMWLCPAVIVSTEPDMFSFLLDIQHTQVGVLERIAYGDVIILMMIYYILVAWITSDVAHVSAVQALWAYNMPKIYWWIYFDVLDFYQKHLKTAF